MSYKKIYQNFSEKISVGFGIDTNYYARSSFWVVAQQVAAACISFFSTLVLARLLSPDSFGVYRYALSGIAIASSFSLTGLSTSVLQGAARGKDGVLSASFLLVTKSGFISASIAFFIAGYYFLQKNNLFGTLFLIGGFYLPLSNSLPLFSSYWIGKKKFKTYSISNILTDLVPAISLVAGASMTSRPEILLMTFLGSGLTVNCLAYLHALKHSIKKGNSEVDYESLTTGRHLSILNIIFLALTQLDRILIFQFLGPAALASYFFATAFPEQIRSMLKGALGTAGPKLATQDRMSVMNTVFKRLMLVSCISVITTFFFIITAPIIYKLIIPQYSDMLKYAQLLALSIPFTTTSYLLALGLQSAHENKKMYSTSIYGGVAQVSSLVIIGGLTQTIGGFIAAKLVGAVLSFVITLYQTKSSSISA
jgi:PST family polysaccharide transporter